MSKEGGGGGDEGLRGRRNIMAPRASTNDIKDR